MSLVSLADEQTETRRRVGFLLNRVKIRNYKSIKECDVELKPFTLLVGRNGAGKSNFLGALRLISEGLRDSLDRASWSNSPWGGIADNGASLPDVSIELELSLPSGDDATYKVRLGIRHFSGITVVEENLVIWSQGQIKAIYHCYEGTVVSPNDSPMPKATSDRLYLVRASGMPEFRPVYNALAAMAFYDLNPQVMRGQQNPSPSLLLTRDGANLTWVFDLLEKVQPSTVRDRIVSYLGLVVPDFGDVRFQKWGPFVTLVFDRRNPGPDEAKSFYIDGVSDGTLRALGILVAVNQLANDGEPIRLVGIEEPETALHPAAAGILMDALREASTHTQVLVTTHSADLLDRYDPEEDHILAVEFRDGRTEIGPIDQASRTIIKKHLDTAGGLLRMDQIEIDRTDSDRQEKALAGIDGNGEAE